MKQNHFKLYKTVVQDHLDDLQHVNNVVYLEWVQEAALAHWKHFTKNQTQNFGLWVVRSHQITYKHPAQLGDSLLIETFVKQTKGVLSERIVTIYLEKTQTQLANCSTQWCYLDADTLKPTPIPASVAELFS